MSNSSVLLVYLIELESLEKTTKSRAEYRPCRYTESDEQLRMVRSYVCFERNNNHLLTQFFNYVAAKLRMQIVCLLIGVFSIRMVKRYKVQSASLFDRRKIAQNNQYNSTTNNSAGGEGRVRYTQVPREDSMETIELSRTRGKVPKSPAPQMQTV